MSVLNLTTQLGYDAVGNLTSLAGPQGRITSYACDALGRGRSERASAAPPRSIYTTSPG